MCVLRTEVNHAGSPTRATSSPEATEQEPAADFVEQWLKIREAKGHTKEAAAAELAHAGATLLAAIKAGRNN